MTVTPPTVAPKARRGRRIVQMSAGQQRLIDEHWVKLLRLPGAKLEPIPGSEVYTLCIKDPGPGSIFNFEAIERDSVIRHRDKNPDGPVDICRANAACLYMTIYNLNQAKALLFRHSTPASRPS